MSEPATSPEPLEILEDEPTAASGAAEAPIVEVRGLVKTYGEGFAVKDVSFEVPRGDIFGFIGPNGAGKTTTLRILATLLDPTAGEVRVGGHCVVNDTAEVRRLIGYMPDHFGVYDGITVAEYLDFFAGAYRLPSRRRAAIIDDVLELTDMTHLRERMVSQLSKGMKQRLCLAKTLVHDPQVLILDEPASALDPRARIEMRVLLKELRRMGKTILISSHILTELSDLCTSIAIIEKGQIVTTGSIGLIHERKWGANRVKITLHEPRDGLEALVGAIPNAELISHEETVVVLDYSGAPGDFHRVLKALVDAELPVVSVEHESRNLENLFMRLTKGDVQ